MSVDRVSRDAVQKFFFKLKMASIFVDAFLAEQTNNCQRKQKKYIYIHIFDSVYIYMYIYISIYTYVYEICLIDHQNKYHNTCNIGIYYSLSDGVVYTPGLFDLF